jgi:putative ATP-binding cassette transporter
VTHKIAYPLTSLFYRQERREADFRFSMMRLREHTESIAFFRGEKFEIHKFHFYFKHLMDNFLQLINMQMRLMTWRSFYSQFSIIFPILVASPRYFSGAITLGGLMQIGVAFGKVENSLAWFIENYALLADYRAITERLKDLHDSMVHWDVYMKNRAFSYKHDQKHILWENVSITLPKGDVILNDVSLEFPVGKRSLITGRTGSGKSTLLRTIAGIWPFGSGSFTLPEAKDMFFIPQQSYMPQGTLQDCLVYPLDRPLTVNERELAKELLAKFGLSKILDQLDVEEEWGRVLSGGEKQKISIIRAILRKPLLLVLDEATGAMDLESDQETQEILKAYLPGTTMIVVSHHHRSIGTFYDAHYHLEEAALKAVEN